MIESRCCARNGEFNSTNRRAFVGTPFRLAGAEKKLGVAAARAICSNAVVLCLNTDRKIQKAVLKKSLNNLEKAWRARFESAAGNTRFIGHSSTSHLQHVVRADDRGGKIWFESGESKNAAQLCESGFFETPAPSRRACPDMWRVLHWENRQTISPFWLTDFFAG